MDFDFCNGDFDLPGDLFLGDLDLNLGDRDFLIGDLPPDLGRTSLRGDLDFDDLVIRPPGDLNLSLDLLLDHDLLGDLEYDLLGDLDQLLLFVHDFDLA